MKKALLWLWMLTKRLYKKPTFLVILVLIPALVLCYSAAAKEESGMITVALASEDGKLPEFAPVQLLRFVPCSPEEAEELVRHGKADTAWVFCEDWAQKVTDFAASPKAENAFVTVLVREDSVMLRLSREKLSGDLYAAVSRQVAINFVRENIPGLDGLTDEVLLQYIDKTFAGNRLFDYGEAGQVQQVHYLTAPLRGLLAVVVVLCGMASAMYWQEDLRRGTFGWLSGFRQSLAELGCQVVALLNVGIAAVLALVLSGTVTAFGQEALTMGAFVLCVAAMSAALRRLCGSIRTLAVLLPLLVVTMLVVCPVFFDLAQIRTLQKLLPVTHYLEGDLGGLGIYTAVSLAVYGLLGALRLRDQ